MAPRLPNRHADLAGGVLSDINFRPIVLPQDADVCVAHRVDAHTVSFGTPDRFYEDHGVDGAGYLTWLAEMIPLEGACVMALAGDEIVGQIESRILGVDRLGVPPRVGMVHMYYVRSAWRRRGIGVQLDDYMAEFYRSQGIPMMALCVSPTNQPAIAFYEGRGWIDEGPHPRHTHVHRMTKQI